MGVGQAHGCSATMDHRMDSPSQYKKQMPKRLRLPPKKVRFLETDLGSPKDEHQGGEQMESLRSFLDRVEQVLPQGGSGTTKKAFGKQELYPESGLFLSSTRLAAIHSEARKDCLRLFHLLFEEFFSPEDCQNAVAFGKHGQVPKGKRVLDKSRVNGILTYVMRCGTLAGWTPVEKTKVKKALINKCRTRAKNT
uniref:Si:ch211-126i22.5 n=1 Tax=Nothobranchius kuhntae TaxID=321403 RepID=A0A1A8IA53_NOTKU